MKYIMLINVKMLTIVGILTFISMITATPEGVKAKKGLILQRFSFLLPVEISCSVELGMRKVL